jgi:pimeloyl-ACP methyl ester carboxylesterase
MYAKSKFEPVPLAILPGLMCDSRMFAGQLAAFPSGMVVDGFYSGASTIEAMAELALTRLPKRFALLGHSMGGRIALEIMRTSPGRVAALVLANTGVHPVRPGEAEKRYALRDLGRAEGMAALVAEWLPPMIAPSKRTDVELVAGLEAMCMDAGLATYEAQIAALLSRPDATTVLPDITCPTLVITGSEDNWAPPAQHEEIAAAIPAAKLSIIAGAGHMLPAEYPAEFNAAIAALLGNIQPSQHS